MADDIDTNNSRLIITRAHKSKLAPNICAHGPKKSTSEQVFVTSDLKFQTLAITLQITSCVQWNKGEKLSFSKTVSIAPSY